MESSGKKKDNRGKLNILEYIFFLEIIKGLLFTLKCFFSKKITVKYPFGEIKMSQRVRGIHYMREKAEGETACIACQTCEKACPSNCITVIKAISPEGKPIMKPSSYNIDLARCIYCGACEDVCPADAIHLGNSFHTATFDRVSDIDLEHLTENYHFYEKQKADGTYGINIGLLKKNKGKKQITTKGVSDV